MSVAWISTADEMPEIDEFVEVTDDNSGEVVEAAWNNRVWWLTTVYDQPETVEVSLWRRKA